MVSLVCMHTVHFDISMSHAAASRLCVHLQLPALRLQLSLGGASKVHHHLLHVVLLHDLLQLRNLIRETLDLNGCMSKRAL